MNTRLLRLFPYLTIASILAVSQPALSDKSVFKLQIAQNLPTPDKPRIELLADVEKQPDGPWNGKSAAVVLSYDDGLNVHLDTVVPLLNLHEIQATFFITGSSETVVKRSADWSEVAKAGHELGNHTMVHPCSGGLPGREWVAANRDLDRYSLDDYLDEINTANTLLASIDSEKSRSFAYPCGDKQVDDISVEDTLKSYFTAARGVNRGINTLGQINLFDLFAYSVSGHSFEQLQAEVDSAREKNGLLVFLFHGVGGEHGLNVDRDQHKLLIEYLNDNSDNLWIAPLSQVADYVVKNGL